MRRIVLFAIAIAAVVVGGRYLVRTQPIAVVVHTVAMGTVESTVANTRAGTLNPARRAKLSPGIGGQVATLHVKEGDRVTAGQVLVELWSEDLKAQLALARCEADAAVAEADAARLRAEYAERDAARQQQLLQRDVAAAELVDRAESEARAQRAAEVAAAAVAATRRQQVDFVQAQIERTVVRAPFAGIVAEVNGEVGEYVTPSPVGIVTPPAVDLIDDAAPYVTAPIDEVDAAAVQPGMAARITLDAFGKRTFAGRVRRIAPYVLDREKQARTVDIEVEFVAPPQDVVLLAGYSVDVEILLAQRDDVLRVPTETLRDGRALVRSADGLLREVAIEAGIANWRWTEAVAGLRAGDAVVVSRDRPGVVVGAVVDIEGGADAASRRP